MLRTRHDPPYSSALRRAQAGFTLVELVAVILILGILAAVLVPRYFELSTQARNAASRGAVSDGMARFSLAYQQYLVDMQDKPGSLASLSNATYLNLGGGGRVNIGDYDLVYTQAGTSLSVQAYARAGTTVLASTSITWP